MALGAVGRFLTRLELYELAGHAGRWYCLLTDLVYEDDDGTPYLATAGTVTDFASVPRWGWSIIPVIGKHTRAAVLHDAQCQERRWPSPFVHALFGRTLQACGCAWLTRVVMVAAVRIGGPDFPGDRVGEPIGPPRGRR